MIIEYQGVTIDLSPSAIKEWTRNLPADGWVGEPHCGEACLVHSYISAALRGGGIISPLVYVSGASQLDPENGFSPHVDIGDQTYVQDEPLRKVVSTFDRMGSREITPASVLRFLEKQGAW